MLHLLKLKAASEHMWTFCCATNILALQLLYSSALNKAGKPEPEAAREAAKVAMMMKSFIDGFGNS